MSVPALRFRDDDGQEFPEWEEKTLGEIAETIQSGKSKGRQDLGEYPLYGSTGVIGFSDRFEYEGKTILIARVGANAGFIYEVDGSYSVSDNTLILVLKKPNNYSFFFNLLTKSNLNKLVFGSGQPLITGGQLKSLFVEVPSLPEQTKIANFLTAVDEKISLLTQKSYLLSQYKKGVMQQIFSQELRFKDDDGQEFPEWEEKKLGDIADITTGNSNRIDSTIGDGAYTFFDRSQDIRTSDIYLFDCEAVIVAGEGQEFIPKHFIGKFDLHQRTYAIIKFKSASGKYLFYYIHNFRYYFLSQAVGSTVKSLRLPMFQQMPIQLPSLPEQTKIANFLTAIDEKITINQTQLNAVKQYKQGLLQQMFV